MTADVVIGYSETTMQVRSSLFHTFFPCFSYIDMSLPYNLWICLFLPNYTNLTGWPYFFCESKSVSHHRIIISSMTKEEKHVFIHIQRMMKEEIYISMAKNCKKLLIWFCELKSNIRDKYKRNYFQQITLLLPIDFLVWNNGETIVTWHCCLLPIVSNIYGKSAIVKATLSPYYSYSRVN